VSQIAILSDIHANLQALQAVLQEVQSCGVEHTVVLGDIVGYGASPSECVDLIRKLGGSCVMGNHDAAMQAVRRRGCSSLDPSWRQSGYLAGLVHSAKSLDAGQAEWLAQLPFTMKIPGAIVAHSSLHEPENFAYIHDILSAEPTLEMLRDETTHKVGFFGHTHVTDVFADPSAVVEWLDGSRIRIPNGVACVVMVGAVGLPRHETDHRASWVLWDPAAAVVEFKKTNYHRLKAAQEIVNSGLPMEAARRLLTTEEEAFLIR